MLIQNEARHDPVKIISLSTYPEILTLVKHDRKLDSEFQSYPKISDFSDSYYQSWLRDEFLEI